MQANFNLNLLIELFVLTFAVFRFTNMIVYEALPFHLGLKLRHYLGVKYVMYKNEDRTNYYYSLEDVIDLYKSKVLDNLDRFSVHSISELVSCFWCCSIWVSSLFVLIRFINFEIYFVLLIILSISAFSIFTERYLKG